MNKAQEVKTLLGELRLKSAGEHPDELLTTAIKEDISCLEFLHQIVQKEVVSRNANSKAKE